MEQAQFINGEVDNNVVIVYSAEDVIPDKNVTCGVDETHRKAQEIIKSQNGFRVTANGCKVVELAIASDASMVTKFGSASAVFNHTIAIMNNVAVLYRHEFVDNIEYKIVTQYVSLTEGNDPLLPNTNSTNSNTVLDNFTAWGQANGFGTDFDIGQFCTNRDFDGTTVGVAWIGAVCTGNRYHIIQDFTNSIAALSVVTAHEIGHNFNAVHDAELSSFIMAPSVNITSTWSPDSKAAISGHINTRGCLAGCTDPVISAFTMMPGATCPGGSITFRDKSVNGQTRNWSFPSGSPSTATIAQPTITYSTPGNYDVSITVNGTSSLHYDNYVVVNTPALNAGACPLPTGAGGTGGIKQFNLNNISAKSDPASSEGKYANRSCTQITTLAKGTSYDFSIELGVFTAEGPNVFEVVHVYIDYNNDGLFNETNERVALSGGDAWAGFISYNATSRPWMRFTTPSTVVENKILRLRVITDTAIPTGACYNPNDGQVEDFGVVFLSDPAPLPVDLISFSGKSEDGYNLLRWETVNESNMKSYAVERSEDGRNFLDAGEVYSENTGRKKNVYELKDDNLSDRVGGYYYKLRMEELDQTTTYSRIVYIKNPDARAELALENCQTLITGMDISYDLVSNSNRTVKVSVFDIMGRCLKTWDKTLGEGKNHVQDKMYGLNSGMMFLSVQAKDQPVLVQKIFK